MRIWNVLLSLLLASCALPPAGAFAYRPAVVASTAWSAPTPAQGQATGDDDDDGGSQCKSAYGTTVCGYHCVAAYGEVRCAQTPAGSCTAEYGNVTCWDPSGGTRRWHRRWRDRDRDGDDDEARSECKSAYGTTVCGYGCVAAYGEVKCASRPGGTCAAAYGEVTCSN